jgi:hypothetical protein
MEVSSAALEMDRLGGLGFAVGAFSNLTQDHLDVHGTMAAYQAAKRLLFAHHLAEGGVAVVNVDDPAGEDMAAAAAACGRRVLRVSSDPEPTRPAQQGAEIRVTWCESTVRGIRARVRTPRGELEASAPPLIGAYNVANLALAVGIAEALGLPHAAIVAGIAALPGVPGRVERVGNTLGLDVLVDYAHTPDALRNVLSALRPLWHPPRLLSACSAAAAIATRQSARSWARPWPRWPTWPSSPATTRAPRRRAPSSIRSCRRCRARSSSTSIAAPRSAPRWPRRCRATSCSSPARATRTTRSSAPARSTSTIARRPRRPWRCARAGRWPSGDQLAGGVLTTVRARRPTTPPTSSPSGHPRRPHRRARATCTSPSAAPTHDGHAFCAPGHGRRRHRARGRGRAGGGRCRRRWPSGRRAVDHRRRRHPPGASARLGQAHRRQLGRACRRRRRRGRAPPHRHHRLARARPRPRS